MNTVLTYVLCGLWGVICNPITKQLGIEQFSGEWFAFLMFGCLLINVICSINRDAN